MHDSFSVRLLIGRLNVLLETRMLATFVHLLGLSAYSTDLFYLLAFSLTYGGEYNVTKEMTRLGSKREQVTLTKDRLGRLKIVFAKCAWRCVMTHRCVSEIA